MNGDYKQKRPLSESQDQLMDRMMSEVGSTQYKAVSFKMSDTLVLTPFSGEYDIFTLMEEDFSPMSDGKKTFTELRIAAQEAAVKKQDVLCRVTLEMIYNIFAKLSGVSSGDKERLMQRECELTEKFSFPRQCGKALFREAKKNNKRVIIAAETIYPAETVKNILESCGYGSYDGLILTSDIPSCTGESYFPAVLEKAGVSAGKLLHIGGDVAFDIELPIVKGAKALLLAPPLTLMGKSGRVRGYAEEQKLFDYDDPQYFTLRCVFGLYAAYGFDIPQNKVPLSDFCTDRYMLGFLVLGAMSLAKDFKPSSEMQKKIIAALEECPEALDGRDDFVNMFDLYFSDIPEKYGSDGCHLPLEFVEKCCASADRTLLQSYISAETMKKWAGSVKEPEIVPFSTRKVKKNALSKLADRMFPPGTRVRTICDGILSKGRR